MTTGVNESKTWAKHVWCNCRYEFHDRKCNLKQKFNNNKCQCECKNKIKYKMDHYVFRLFY